MLFLHHLTVVTLGDMYYYLHLTYEGIIFLRGQLTCPMSFAYAFTSLFMHFFAQHAFMIYPGLPLVYPSWGRHLHGTSQFLYN